MILLIFPSGDIKVRYKQLPEGSYLAVITLPLKLNGWFIAKNKKAPLHSGRQVIKFGL